MSPDKRKHRGAHPEDRRLFCPATVPILRQATGELSWLLTRGYPMDASLKLVGDRHRLRERQRAAVRRSACSDEASADRRRRCYAPDKIAERSLTIDGFNLLITLETALSGGVILRGRDGCLRDLASIHGSYRTVTETDAAIRLAGAFLAAVAPREVTWILDRPVSNSGRLRQRIEEAAEDNGWPWSARLEFNPDKALMETGGLLATSDSTILDAGAQWVNLAAAVVEKSIPEAQLIDLRVGTIEEKKPGGGLT